jgi:AAA15 family ATPase/GTPase
VESFGKRRILHSAVVYGANAAGKTNLISAAAFVDQFVNTSAERQTNTVIDVQPYLLTEKQNNEPTEFEMTFIDDENIRYQFGFHVTSTRIIREWLIAYPKGLPQTWYERELNLHIKSGYDWNFGRNLKGQNAQIADLTRSDVLYLSNATKFNHQQLSPIFKWFQKNIRVINSNSIPPFDALMLKDNITENKRLQKDICRFLEVADLGITGYDIKEETFTDQNLPKEMPLEIKKLMINKKHLNITMRHVIEGNLEISLPLEVESEGTQSLFALSVPLSQVLKNGWTMFVDELDSSLHPLLVQYILKLFHNPETNPHGAQLIFNTHDTTIMDQELFRRDQIWFVEKDRQGCSHLYSLLEYSPRNKESLAKNYLQGRYGSIPFLGN